MPELPEVARTVRQVKEKIGDSTLNNIKIHSGRYKRHGSPEGMDLFLQEAPLKIEDVFFRGKLIIFKLKSLSSGQDWWIWNTLGMSGGWKQKKSNHGHLEFITSKGSIFFEDIRNFGTFKFTNSSEQTNKKIEQLGPDHLSCVISDSEFKKRLQKRSKFTLAEVLMDQKIISGIGNYIKAEALYISRISPHRKVETLTDKEFSRLNSAVLNVIQSSFNNGGATIKTYTDIKGDSGGFVFYFKVYGRKMCEEGYEVRRETTKDKRTTHWVPELQK
jgi:formamidopyrimidine-DNA glycosylase